MNGIKNAEIRFRCPLHCLLFHLKVSCCVCECVCVCVCECVSVCVCVCVCVCVSHCAAMFHRWLRVCVRAKWEESVPLALTMATEQGRMKFTRPLFR